MTDDRRLAKTRAEARLFRYERELQEAIRQQLTKVEPGLVEADGGRERLVATGKIDIVALDLAGRFVVIELKVAHAHMARLSRCLLIQPILKRKQVCRAVRSSSRRSFRSVFARRRSARVTFLWLLTNSSLALQKCFLNRVER